jgi:hypothetical protein
MKKTINKIARRKIILGTFASVVIPDETYGLVRFTGRGLIVDYDRAGRQGFLLKWVHTPRSKTRGGAVYRIQITKDDIEALLGSQYDHLVIHLGGADYPYCVITRAEFLGMGVSVGGCIEVVYQRGNRKFRVAGGTVEADQPMRIEVRRFWHCGQADETVFATAA